MIETILEQFLVICKYFWVKLLLSIPIGYFVFRKEQSLVVFALLLILLMDTALGVWVSYKYRTFSSYRLSRITTKIARYGIGLVSIWILGCVSPTLFGWSFQFFGTFFVLTEVFSIFEKLALLGLRLPNQLLAKLNKDFYNFYFGDVTTSKEAASKILSKNSRDYVLSPDDIALKENMFNKR